ncbi:hypothetical protein PIB30_045578 [Stylosanthes scabra]|uniref:Uncharacterized protein n=1 Tax=Stylosanthes scabra TaxID=79078 RepID=A0ABU6YDM4_9FABA|nr:hypothetical protein [Stylosanthes scabra]
MPLVTTSVCRGVVSTLLYTSTWMLLLIATVVLASLPPTMAFMLAISKSSHFSNGDGDGDGSLFVRIPLDFPRDMVHLPHQAVTTSSHIDFFLPTLFAALVVAASACFLHAVGPCEFGTNLIPNISTTYRALTETNIEYKNVLCMLDNVGKYYIWGYSLSDEDAV